MDSNSLRQLLEENGIDSSLYGKGKAKTLNSLLKEINEGESKLEFNPLTRVITVLFLSLMRNGKVLTEVDQYFHQTPEREAFSRQRMSVLAEKMLENETPDAAVKRALNEELGVDYIPSDTIIHRTIETRISASYPGLPTKYITYQVVMDAPDEIPNEKFEFTEYFPNGNPRLTTTWDWL